MIKDFLSFTDDNKDYDFCSKLRDKFDSDTIYKFKTVIPSKLDEAYREYLNDREYSVYEAFKLVTVQNTIENFIDYLDRMKELNSPYIKILVGSRNENYNYLKWASMFFCFLYVLKLHEIFLCLSYSLYYNMI